MSGRLERETAVGERRESGVFGPEKRWWKGEKKPETSYKDKKRKKAEGNASKPRVWCEAGGDKTRIVESRRENAGSSGQREKRGVGRAQRVDQAATTRQIKLPWLSQHSLSGLRLLPSRAGGSQNSNGARNPPELPPSPMLQNRTKRRSLRRVSGGNGRKRILWQPLLDPDVKHGQAGALEMPPVAFLAVVEQVVRPATQTIDGPSKPWCAKGNLRPLCGIAGMKVPLAETCLILS